MTAAGRHICVFLFGSSRGVLLLGFFNGMSKMTMHTKITIALSTLIFFIFLFFSLKAFAQQTQNCGTTNYLNSDAWNCNSAANQANGGTGNLFYFCVAGTQSGTSRLCSTLRCNPPTFNDPANPTTCKTPCTAPNVEYNGACQIPVATPQECESPTISVTAVQMPGGGYVCMPGADYPCEEGMTPGTVAGSTGIISICDQPTGGSSSSNSSTSSTSSSAGSSDGGGGSSSGGGGDGSSSTGSTGSSSSSSSTSSSTGGGGSSISGCPVSPDSTCPNKYEINGQWFCFSGSSFCSGGSSSSGSGSSSSEGEGAGDCDPTAHDYSLCVGTLEEINDNQSNDIISGFEQSVGEELDGVYSDIESDIENFTSIDEDFKDSPSALSQAIKAFLPSPSSCSPVELNFLNTTKTLSCEKFEIFRLIFGWFLTILAVIHIWGFATAPVQR